MKLSLRWYQQAAVDALAESLFGDAVAHPLAAIVTGGGKSLVVAALIERILIERPQWRVLCLVPTRQLIIQNVEEAKSYLDVQQSKHLGIYCAGLKRKERFAKVIFGTIASVQRAAASLGRIDVVIVDEAHGVNAERGTGYAKTFEALRKRVPDLRIAGVTATPYRQRGTTPTPLPELGVFDKLVYDGTAPRDFNRMAKEGYIILPVLPDENVKLIDTSQVSIKRGEFDETELSNAALANAETDVENALRMAAGRSHLLWFCVSVEHARRVNAHLEQLGEMTTLIVGDMDSDEQDKSLRAFLTKETRNLVSVAMITTGFNAKHVDCIVCLRPTASLVLWQQIIGRGFRPYPGKTDFLLVDAGGNLARHGPINAPTALQRDSRDGMWVCGDVDDSLTLQVYRHVGEEADVDAASTRVTDENLITLPFFKKRACGHLNDNTELYCRCCSRPRFAAFLSKKKSHEEQFKEQKEYGVERNATLLLGDSAGLELIDVTDTQLSFDASKQVIQLEMNVGGVTHTLPLDFDRERVPPRIYAAYRKLWACAVGHAHIPRDTHIAWINRHNFNAPTKAAWRVKEDGTRYLAHLRWEQYKRIKEFNYSPEFD